MTKLQLTVVVHSETPTDKSPSSALLLRVGGLESFSSLFPVPWPGAFHSHQYRFQIPAGNCSRGKTAKTSLCCIRADSYSTQSD